VNAFGVAEPLVQIERSTLSGEDRLLVELPGLTNVEEAVKLIGETPTLEFKLERAKGPEQDKILKAQEVFRAAMASGTTPTITAEVLQDPYFVSIGLDGKYLKRSKLDFDPQTNVPMVSIEWDEKGKEIFASTTAANIGKSIGIYLDGQLISAPVVQIAITDGKAVITGDYSTPEGRAEAKLLAQRLNAGALPVSVSIIGSEVVEPVLGAQALAAGVQAAMYGFLFIMLLMIVWYRLPGLVGVISLSTYIAIVLAIFKLIPVTLSAAAIAGFVISIGLAVDGNILTFERLKEEMNKGKNIKDAMEEAFGRAWTSIRDSNIASIIVAVILFFVGTSVIKGFALTLGIGVVTSLITNVVLTKHLLRAIAPHKQSSLSKFLFKSPF
jgi:protein-export membrane protein SecD